LEGDDNKPSGGVIQAFSRADKILARFKEAGSRNGTRTAYLLDEGQVHYSLCKTDCSLYQETIPTSI